MTDWVGLYRHDTVLSMLGALSTDVVLLTLTVMVRMRTRKDTLRVRKENPVSELSVQHGTVESTGSVFSTGASEAMEDQQLEKEESFSFARSSAAPRGAGVFVGTSGNDGVKIDLEKYHELLQASKAKYLTASETITNWVIVFEHSKEYVHIPVGYHVHRAYFGDVDNPFGDVRGMVVTEKCKSLNASSTLLEASAKLFGDPWPGHMKGLVIELAEGEESRTVEDWFMFWVFWNELGSIILKGVTQFCFSFQSVFGLQLALSLMIMSSIYRQNIISILYICLFVPPYIVHGPMMMQKLWPWIIGSMSIFILWQFSVLLGLPPAPDGSSRSIDFPESLANSNSTQEFWLIGNFTISQLQWDFWTYFSACLQLVFWSTVPLLRRRDTDHETFEQQREGKKPNQKEEIEKQAGDYLVVDTDAQKDLVSEHANAARDATSHQSYPLKDAELMSKKAAESLCSGLFISFLLSMDKILIVVVFSFGTFQATLLRMGYLVLSLVLLFSTDLEEGREKQFLGHWYYLQYYNLIILLLAVIYQIPYIDDWSNPNDYLPDFSDVVGLQKVDDDSSSAYGMWQNVVIFILVDLGIKMMKSKSYLKVITFYETHRKQAAFMASRVHQLREAERQIQVENIEAIHITVRQEFRRIFLKVSKHIEKESLKVLERQARQLKAVEGTEDLQDIYLELSSADQFFNDPEVWPQEPPKNWNVLQQSWLQAMKEGEDISFQADEAAPQNGDKEFSTRNASSTSKSATPVDQNQSEDASGLQQQQQKDTGEIKEVKRTAGDSSSEEDEKSLQEKDLEKEREKDEGFVRSSIVAVIKGIRVRIIRLINPLLWHRFEVDREDNISIWNNGTDAGIKGTQRVTTNLNLKQLTPDPNYSEFLLLHLLYRAFLSQTFWVVYAAFVINLMINANVLNAVVPVLFWSFGLIEHPGPPKGFWVFCLWYTSIIITFIFFFQLDIFCITYNGMYALQPNPDCDSSFDGSNIPVNSLVSLFGLYKAPNYIVLVLAQLFCLLSTLLHRTMLLRLGTWEQSKDIRFQELASARLALLHLYEKEIRQQAERNRRQYSDDELSDEEEIDDTDDRFSADDISEVGHDVQLAEDDTSAADTITVETEGTEKDSDGPGSVSKPTHDDLGTSKIATHLLELVPWEVMNYFLAIIPYPDERIHALKPGQDFYSSMLFFELLSALWIILFYSNMASTKVSEISGSLNTNLFSGYMVVTFLVQLAMIFVDRAIFLKRSLAMKLVFQYLNVIVWTYAIFFDWPTRSLTPFQQNGYLQIFFLLKVAYFSCSAMQIKFGYVEVECEGFGITSTPSTTRGAIFRTYRAVPFLFEMNTLMDFIFKDSALDLFEMFKFEDIYATLFGTQCDIEYRKKRGRGEKQTVLEILLYGVLIFLLLASFLVLPLLLFSTASPVTAQNNIIGGAVYVRFSGPTGIYDILQLSLSSINNISTSTFNTLIDDRLVDETDDPKNCQNLTFAENADTYWGITPPALESMVANLDNPSLSMSAEAVW